MAPGGTLVLKCYRNLVIDHIQPLTYFYLFPKLKSHLPGCHFGKKVRVVEKWSGDQCANVSPNGIAMHEHRWTKCIDVMGGLS